MEVKNPYSFMYFWCESTVTCMLNGAKVAENASINLSIGESYGHCVCVCAVYIMVWSEI